MVRRAYIDEINLCMGIIPRRVAQTVTALLAASKKGARSDQHGGSTVDLGSMPTDDVSSAPVRWSLRSGRLPTTTASEVSGHGNAEPGWRIAGRMGRRRAG